MGGRPKLTIPEIIRRATDLHNSKYNYSALVDYENQKTQLPIICPHHGLFHVSCGNHLNRKVGCKKCADVNIAGQYHKKTATMCIEEARAVHGDKYDYSLVVYKNIHTKIIIVCPKHGEFRQTPASHIKGMNGCPGCGDESCIGGYGEKRFLNSPELKDKPATLYVVRLSNDTEQFIKIGITRKKVAHRLASIQGYRAHEIHTITGTSYNLFKLEQATKKHFTQHKYCPDIKFPGHTECLTESALDRILAYLGAK